MTHCTPAQARYIADRADGKQIPAGLMGASVAAISSSTALRSLADQLEQALSHQKSIEADHIADARKLVAAPAVPAPVASVQNFTTPDDDLNVLLQETYAIGNCTNCSHDEASLWLDALQKVLAKITPPAAPVAQLSEPLRTALRNADGALIAAQSRIGPRRPAGSSDPSSKDYDHDVFMWDFYQFAIDGCRAATPTTPKD